MKISQLYVYPVKSIRGIAVDTATVTKTGFAHDRQFMLLKVDEDDSGEQKLKNMHVPHFPEMSLFTTAFRSSGSAPQPDKLVVTYTPSADPDPVRPNETRTLEVSLTPDVSNLETVEVVMHSSSTTAYRMPDSDCAWFTECFGYEVIFAYIGPHTRAVLGTLSPNVNANANAAKSTTGWLTSTLKSVAGYKDESATISFADCANFLVVTEESVANASSRLPEGEEMDVTKFRPNIVVSGSEKAWDEDYWSRLSVNDEGGKESAEIIFTANCVRCQSINVDYATGKFGTGESGQMLKKLQGDRRVDRGAKYSPVFGRYGYLGKGLGNEISVGQEVVVGGRNKGHDKFDWPGIGGVPPAPTKA